jgi:hypothetical protein
MALTWRPDLSRKSLGRLADSHHAISTGARVFNLQSVCIPPSIVGNGAVFIESGGPKNAMVNHATSPQTNDSTPLVDISCDLTSNLTSKPRDLTTPSAVRVRGSSIFNLFVFPLQL